MAQEVERVLGNTKLYEFWGLETLGFKKDEVPSSTLGRGFANSFF